MSNIWNINSPYTNTVKIPSLILDTNILLDVFYSYPGKKANERERHYQDFISKCLSKKIPLYTTELNIYETFHVIEGINRDLYKKDLPMKEYHKIKDEKIKVHEHFRIVYEAIKRALKILPSSLSDEQILEYISIIDSNYDLYDFALLKIAEKNKLKFILTNDTDFCSNLEYIKNYDIFTQNNQMLAIANNQ